MIVKIIEAATSMRLHDVYAATTPRCLRSTVRT